MVIMSGGGWGQFAAAGRRSALALGASGAVMVLLAGCGIVNSAVEAEGLHDQADRVLARWDEATQGAATPNFVPVGQLTDQVGDWELSTGENNKIALLTGQVVAVTDLPSDPVPEGTVTYADGTTTLVKVMSAAEALQQVSSTVEQTDCSGCDPLQVTGARLVQRPVKTSRGEAKAPAWLFSVRGTRVKVSRIAIDPKQIVALPPPSGNGRGTSIEGATVSADGLSLTVSFTGSPGPASEPCGADYTAEAVESTTAVVVIVTGQRGGDGFCPAIGAFRTAVAPLSQPLGDRTVLEIAQGLPVPLTEE